MDSAPTVSVVVPVFHSTSTLRELLSRLDHVLPTICEQYELILVDDASTDDSWALVHELVNAHPWVHGVRLMKNYGQHNALLCGIRKAKNEIIVTMDDDLQHPPEEIPALLSMLCGGYDVVYGTPEVEQHGLWRNLASQITKLALRSAMGIRVARHASAFRAFRQHLRKAFENYNSPFVSIDVLLTWGTTRFGAIPVRHESRRLGTSNYTFGRLVTHALNMMTGFSTMPLQFASITGFFFTLFGVGILVYVIGRYLITNTSVPGFPFLASIIAIFSGAQLFALGIIGEYLARMHFRTLERPAYVTREVVSNQVNVESLNTLYERKD